MFFVFGRSPKPGRWIETPLGDIPGVRWSAWRKGTRLTEQPPVPLRFTLKKISPHAADHGPHLPSFLNAACPLFSVELLEALQACGVDNLDSYPVLLHDPETSTAIESHRAVNVIGLIAAADMVKSDAVVEPGGPPLIDVSFDRLVIDDAKTRGVRFFRLAESAATLVVHETVRAHLVKDGFDDLVFYRPDQVAT